MDTRWAASVGIRCKRLAKKDQVLRWQRFVPARRSGVDAVAAGANIGQGRFGAYRRQCWRRRSGAGSVGLPLQVMQGTGKAAI